MTIETRPGRAAGPAPRPRLRLRSSCRPGRRPGAVPATARRSAARARPSSPATALYADDLVFPGAWYGATIRSTDAHARLLGDRPRPRLRLVDGRRRHRRRHPRREHRGEHRRRPADPRPGRRRDPPPGRAGRPAGGAPIARRSARRAGGVRLRTEPLPPVFDPLASTVRLRPLRARQGRRRRRASRRPTWSSRATYRVGHQEQLYIENNAMIAVPARGRRRRPSTASLQCPYYVHKALKRGARARRRARPGSSRPRPAAGSAARRSTRR